MSLLHPRGRRTQDEVLRDLVCEFYKEARSSEPELSHALAGRLYASKSGWILMNVPNALVRGAFNAIDAPGVQLPPSKDGELNAHVSVMRPEELESIGGIDKITERGHMFHYTLGPLRTVNPLGWGEMSKAWLIEVNSPELKKLRSSYGLSPLPKNNEFKFHITVGVRKKSVLSYSKGVSKTSDFNGVASGDAQAFHEYAVCHNNECRDSGEMGNVSDVEWKRLAGEWVSLPAKDKLRYHRQVKVSATSTEIATAATKADKSPSDAQKETGNYRKGHITINGLPITIENAKGSMRSGTAPDGTAWSVTMKAHYGYIKRTLGADGDHVDVFVGPHPESDNVYIVNQLEGGKFDEVKCMLGYKTQADAKAGYLSNYADDWDGCGSITKMSLNDFKTWLEGGDTSKAARFFLGEAAKQRLGQPLSWNGDESVLKNLGDYVGDIAGRAQHKMRLARGDQKIMAAFDQDRQWDNLLNSLRGNDTVVTNPIDQVLERV